jgi:hypothetical protein
MRLLLTLTFVIAVYITASAQNAKDTTIKSPVKEYSYAYITVEGKSFSKKLKVYVDLGDTPEQIIAGKQYSEILTNKTSCAAVLNYMSENEYELVESRDNNFSVQGSGGTSGVVFIMKRRK